MPSPNTTVWFDETLLSVLGAFSAVDAVSVFFSLKTVPGYLHPHQHCKFHMRIQMFPTTNRHWNSRLIVPVCVFQLSQNPNLPQAPALSIRVLR